MEEFEQFETIRNLFCKKHQGVSEGKMMSSPAIHYQAKVFAFFSRKNKMVFKLGKTFLVDEFDFKIEEFNPFKNKGPLAGWYEVGYKHHDKWEGLTHLALKTIKFQ